ncbi:hypothetical protein BDN67DRAFT_390444 [Paxillus ammoniavirescens]|nr:hypothetical protein BDN67DRAFT_390444 [Paxillus ammoniavirescens]
MCSKMEGDNSIFKLEYWNPEVAEAPKPRGNCVKERKRRAIDMSQLYDTARNAYRRVRGPPKPPPLVLPGHTNPIWSVVFPPDGKEVISGCAGGNIRGWRVEDGCELKKGRNGMWENGPVYAIAASSDGQ